MAGVEHSAVFLAQAGQRGDREETAVAAQPVPPSDQPIVLAVVHSGAGAVPAAGGDGQRQVAQPQQVAVDSEVGNVAVGAQ